MKAATQTPSVFILFFRCALSYLFSLIIPQQSSTFSFAFSASFIFLSRIRLQSNTRAHTQTHAHTLAQVAQTPACVTHRLLVELMEGRGEHSSPFPFFFLTAFCIFSEVNSRLHAAFELCVASDILPTALLDVLFDDTTYLQRHLVCGIMSFVFL